MRMYLQKVAARSTRSPCRATSQSERLATQKEVHMVKACEGGKEKIIRFGQQGDKNMKISARPASWTNIKRGKMSAAYWADKVKWSPKPPSPRMEAR